MNNELELYGYATASQLQKGRVKVGHAKVGRAKERIKEQFGTSNDELPEIIEIFGVLPLGVRDHHIHSQLIKNGKRKVIGGKGQEFFEANFDDVRKAYNDVVHGSSRRDNYKLREEQKQAIERAKKMVLKRIFG